MLNVLWWWSLAFASLYAIKFDMLDAAAAAKSSSQRNDKFEVLRNGEKSYTNEKSDKSQQAGDDGDINNGALKGGGDIIPIPDHLLKSDYDHHYSYDDDEHLEGYEDYQDEYHLNSGKNLIRNSVVSFSKHLLVKLSPNKFGKQKST